MPYLLVQDFAAGLDHRKDIVSSKAGSLRDLTNGFINAGGEIEKRNKRSIIGTITSEDTIGLAHHEGQLFVFGTEASVTGLPQVLTYQQLVHTDPALTITRILAAETYGDELYVVAKMSNDTTAHFLDGVHVTDQDVSGPSAISYKKKMLTHDGRNLRGSAIGRADVLDPENTAGEANATIPGAFIIDMKQEDGSGGDLIGLEPYYSFLAIMAQTSIQIWAFDPDPDLSQQIQTLHATGLIAHNAKSRYGNGDVLYLANTGIRSIRARDSSNAAVLNDIGSPIDKIIQEKRINEFTGPEHPIYADMDPMSGHWWLAWGNDVYVLAQYPLSKVTAWSRFRFNEPIDYLTRGSSRLFFRSGNDIYIYGAIAQGGDPLDESASFPPLAEWYDDSEIIVQTPMLDADDPATEKYWHAFDLVGTGDWKVQVAPDPLQPDTWQDAGIATAGVTYSKGQWGLQQRSTHLAVKLISTSPDAKLSAIALHYRSDQPS